MHGIQRLHDSRPWECALDLFAKAVGNAECELWWASLRVVQRNGKVDEDFVLQMLATYRVKRLERDGAGGGIDDDLRESAGVRE